MVDCSCVVVKDYGEESLAKYVIKDYFKCKKWINKYFLLIKIMLHFSAILTRIIIFEWINLYSIGLFLFQIRHTCTCMHICSYIQVIYPNMGIHINSAGFIDNYGQVLWRRNLSWLILEESFAFCRYGRSLYSSLLVSHLVIVILLQYILIVSGDYSFISQPPRHE